MCKNKISRTEKIFPQKVKRHCGCVMGEIYLPNAAEIATVKNLCGRHIRIALKRKFMKGGERD